MENIHQEPEENQNPKPKTEDGNVIPPDEDMLTSEPKIDRSHASVNASGPTVSEFTPPPFTGKVEEEAPEPPKPEDHPLANPGMKDAPPHAKQEGADFIADKILMGYAEIKRFIGHKMVLVSPKKLDRLEAEGKIDRSIPLRTPGGNTITAGIAIDHHNDEAEKLIDQNVLTKDFYDSAKPMLMEELAKRNISATNTQMLLGITLIDLYTFGNKVVKPLWEQRGELIHAFQEATQAYKQAGHGFTPQYAQAASQQSAGNNTPPPSSPAATPPPPDEPMPDMPAAYGGNVDSAFDDLQTNPSNFMHAAPSATLPREFDEMERGPIRTMQPRRRPVRKKKKANRNKSKVKVIIPPTMQ